MRERAPERWAAPHCTCHSLHRTKDVATAKGALHARLCFLQRTASLTCSAQSAAKIAKDGARHRSSLLINYYRFPHFQVSLKASPRIASSHLLRSR